MNRAGRDRARMSRELAFGAKNWSASAGTERGPAGRGVPAPPTGSTSGQGLRADPPASPLAVSTTADRRRSVRKRSPRRTNGRDAEGSHSAVLRTARIPSRQQSLDFGAEMDLEERLWASYPRACRAKHHRRLPAERRVGYLRRSAGLRAAPRACGLEWDYVVGFGCRLHHVGASEAVPELVLL
jgi:hypothetical protein